MTVTVLWLIAAVLVIAGLYEVFVAKAVLFGIILIVLGCLVGPGGFSIFR